MKNRYQEVTVPLVSLRLDLENARHPALENQRKVYEWMLSGKPRVGQKLFNLAQDIVEFGPSPIDRILVMRGKDSDWHVYEGNRRVCALQLLHNPDIAPTPQWATRFRKLKHDSKYAPPAKIKCVEALDEEYAYHLIELRHQGERDGVGITPWGAEEKARHDIKRDKKSRHFRSLLLLDYVKKSPNFDPYTKKLAQSGFPITTLDRLLSDKEVRQFIGLHYDRTSQELSFFIDPQESNKTISRIITEFGSKEKKVDDVKSKEDRRRYTRKFPREFRPDHSQLLDNRKPIEDLIGTDVSKPAQRKKKKIRSKSSQQVTVVPTGAVWGHKAQRAEKIFQELRTLKIRKKRDSDAVYINAVALLLRAYVDISVSVYLLEKNIECPKPEGWDSGDVSLHLKISKAKDYALEEGIIDALSGQAIQKVISQRDHAANPNTLNHYVHNRKAVLDADRLMVVWDSYSELLEAIWEECK